MESISSSSTITDQISIPVEQMWPGEKRFLSATSGEFFDAEEETWIPAPPTSLSEIIERVKMRLQQLAFQECRGAQLMAHLRHQLPLPHLPISKFEPPPLPATPTSEWADGTPAYHDCLLGCQRDIEDTDESIILHYAMHFTKKAVESMNLGQNDEAFAVMSEVLEKEEEEVVKRFMEHVEHQKTKFSYYCRRYCILQGEPMTLEQIIFHNMGTHRQLQHVILRHPNMNKVHTGFPELYKRLFPSSTTDEDIPWELALDWEANDWQEVLL